MAQYKNICKSSFVNCEWVVRGGAFLLLNFLLTPSFIGNVAYLAILGI